MAVVQTGSLLSSSITSLVQLTRMGWLAGFLDNSKSLLGIAVSRERAQGNCWHDRMVWAAFLPQVPGLARVRSTRARPPVPILDLGGYALW